MELFKWNYEEGLSARGEMTATTPRNLSDAELSGPNNTLKDCYVTPHIVEFINTLTNVCYAYLGLKGVLNTSKHSKDPVIILAHTLLICVGIGSTAYHTNIKYYSQMADEISMLYTTTVILFSAFSITIDRSSRKYLASGILSVASIAATFHCLWGEDRPFNLCFAFMVFVIFFKCTWLLRSKVSDPRSRAQMASLASFGAVTFLSGGVLWKLDFILCKQLRAFRNAVGMPLGFVTELHGWWHILTGLGGYYFVVFIEYLRLYNTESTRGAHDSRTSTLIWPGVFTLPRLEVRRGKGTRRD